MWQSFDQIYGKRWSDSFGSDPLGKADAGNRMEQWLDCVKFISWPAVRSTVVKIRSMPKPFEYWLPDLQTFSQLAGREAATLAPVPRKPWNGTWIDKVGNLYLLRAIVLHGPFSEASLERLREVTTNTCQQFNTMIGTELKEEWNEQEANEVKALLEKRYAATKVELMSEEEKRQSQQRCMGLRGSSVTKANSNSSTPTGDLDLGEPSNFD